MAEGVHGGEVVPRDLLGLSDGVAEVVDVLLEVGAALGLPPERWREAGWEVRKLVGALGEAGSALELARLEGARDREGMARVRAALGSAASAAWGVELVVARVEDLAGGGAGPAAAGG